MTLRLFILSFVFWGSHAFSEAPHYSLEKLTPLLEVAHKDWQRLQKNIPLASEMEFILRRQSGYDAPEGDYFAEVKDYTYMASTKHFKAKLVLNAGEKNTKTYPLEGFVYPLIEVPSVVIPLASGSVISPEDLEFIMIREDRLSPQTETKADQLVGMEVINALQAHKPILKRFVKSPRLIQKGEFVDITLSDGGILLSAQGKALEAGGKDEFISVMNNSSKKIVQGKVIGPKQVKIMTVGSM